MASELTLHTPSSLGCSWGHGGPSAQLQSQATGVSPSHTAHPITPVVHQLPQTMFENILALYADRICSAVSHTYVGDCASLCLGGEGNSQ